MLDVVEGLVHGELPSKRQVAYLISTGLTIAAISEATGFSEVIIRDIVE